MIKIIKGSSYDFMIVCLKKHKSFCFYIKAIYKLKKLYSYINNLNCILSNLDIWLDNTRVAESRWVIYKGEVKNLFNFSVKLIEDNQFKNFLEKQLNIDRQIGEWECKIKN